MSLPGMTRWGGREAPPVVPGYDGSIWAYWLDPSDLSTMKQDRTGASATVAAAVDSPVGSWRNKGTVGGWLTCVADANRPILRLVSGLYYLEMNGTNQYFTLPTITITTDMTTVRATVRPSISTEQFGMANGSSTAYYDYWFSADNKTYLGLGQEVNAGNGSNLQTGAFVFAAQRTTGIQVGRRNGQEHFRSTLASVAGTLNTIGKSATYYSAERLYGYIFNPTLMSEADLVAAEAYMATKCGSTMAFDPSLFSHWYDASDMSSMKQDRTGASATVAAAVNSPVGSWLNKGRFGSWATCPADTNRPILRQSGALFYLEFNGSNNYFDIPLINSTANMAFCRGHYRPTAGTHSFGFANGVEEAHWYTNNTIVSSIVNVSFPATSAADTSTGSFVLTTRATGGTLETRKNGVQIATAASGSPSGGVFYMGRNAANYTAGGIYNAMGNNAYCPDAAGMEAFMAAKAGVTLP